MPYKTKGNRLVNEVTLGDGYPLSSNLKPLKVGGKTSPLEMATAYPDDSNSAKVKVVGDLEVTGSIKGTTTADITGVTLTADDANIASDTEGSADFTIAGGEGIDTSVSGTTVTIAGEAASTTNRGVLELATTAETTTGTDAFRAVTPDGLKDGYQGSSNVVTTGALDSGSITSGFGAIDNGSSNITTTGTVASGPSTSTSNTITGATLTASGSDDYSLKSTQTLNQGMVAGGTQEYRQISTELTETDADGWDNVYLIEQKVDGQSRFKVDSAGNATFKGTVTSDNGVSGRFQVMGQYEVYGRYSSVNTWYVGNQSFGTGITEGDWGGGFKMNYAQFTAVSDVKLLGWKFIGSFSSTVDWEMEVWHTETDSDGNSDPTEATKVGSTQSVSPTATRIYTLGETGLTYDIPAGDQLYVLVRYTSGSGTKNSYGTVGFEFNNA